MATALMQEKYYAIRYFLSSALEEEKAKSCIEKKPF